MHNENFVLCLRLGCKNLNKNLDCDGTFVVNCKGWGEGGLLKTEQDGEPLAGTKFFFFTWVLHGNQTFLLQLAN